MAGQTVVVSVLADTKAFTRNMQNLANDSGLKKLGSDFTKLGKTIAAGFGVALAGLAVFAKDSLEEASKLQQSMGGVDAVFKEQSKTVHKWAKEAANDLGLSANSYNEFATVVGSQLKNMGIPMSDVTGLTDDLIGMGADLAAQFGGPTSDAVSALSSLLRGEADPIERYGISIKKSDVNARMAEKGLVGLTGAALKNAEALTILELLSEQSADAQGAFARETNTLAGQTERLKAKFTNVRAELGTYLLPIATKVVAFFGDRMEPMLRDLTFYIDSQVIPAFQNLKLGIENFTFTIEGGENRAEGFIGKMGELGESLTEVRDFFVDGKEQFDKLMNALGPGAGITAGLATAFAAIATVFRVIKMITPTGAILTLITSLVYAWQNSETFRTTIINAFNEVKAVVGPAIEEIKTFITSLGDTNTETGAQLEGLWTQVKDTLMAAWDALVEATGLAIEAMQTLWEEWGEEIKTFLATTWDAIVLIFSGALEQIRGYIEIWSGIMNGDWTQVWEGVKMVWSGALTAIQGLLTAFGAAIIMSVQLIGQTVNAVWLAFVEVLKAAWNAAWEAIKAKVSEAWESIKAFVASGINEVQQSLSNALNGIQALWSGVWGGISGIASSAWGSIKSFVSNGMSQVSSSVSNGVSAVRNVWSSAWSTVSSFVSSSWSSVRSTVSSGASSILTTIQGIPARITGAFSNMGTLLVNAGKNVIGGFIDGLKSKFESVKSSLGDLTSKLTSWKGPESLDKIILKGAGQLVVEGFVTGLESKYDTAKRSLKNFTKDLSNTDMGQVKLRGGVAVELDRSFTGGGATTGVASIVPGATYNITVQTLVPTADTGRQIVKAIRDYERSGGIR